MQMITGRRPPTQPWQRKKPHDQQWVQFCSLDSCRIIAGHGSLQGRGGGGNGPRSRRGQPGNQLYRGVSSSFLSSFLSSFATLHRLSCFIMALIASGSSLHRLARFSESFCESFHHSWLFHAGDRVETITFLPAFPGERGCATALCAHKLPEEKRADEDAWKTAWQTGKRMPRREAGGKKRGTDCARAAHRHRGEIEGERPYIDYHVS